MEEERWAGFLRDVGWVVRVSADARARLDRHLAPRFSLLQDVYLDENTISNVLADLFDPAGSHGQGDRFLKALLDHLDRPDLASGNVLVFREEPTRHIPNSNRRMDILVDFAGRFGIAVENKPWDQEQHGQLTDYVTELEARYRGQFLLIYLPGAVAEPTSISADRRKALTAAGHFLVVDYPDWLVPLLRRFRDVAVNERVRAYVDDLQRRLGAWFGAAPEPGGIDMPDPTDPLVQFILADDDRLRNAVAVASQAEALRFALARDAAVRISAGLAANLPLGWSVDEQGATRDPFARYVGISIRHPRHGARVKVQSDGDDAKRWIVGVCLVDGPFKADVHPFRDLLRAHLEKNVRKVPAATPWWPWYHNLDDGLAQWTLPTLLRLKERPDLVERIVHRMTVIAGAVQAFFDTNPGFLLPDNAVGSTGGNDQSPTDAGVPVAEPGA